MNNKYNNNKTAVGIRLRLVVEIRYGKTLWENMTPSTKPEVHNVSQRHPRSSEPWPRVALMKIHHVIILFRKYLCGHTDRHVTLITLLRSPTRAE